MPITSNIDKLHQIQYSWYSWRNNASTTTMVLLSFAVACFTGLMAQVSIAIPWSPVLITFQTFAVLLAGVFLGGKYGGFSMILYTLLGIIGMPWFTNMNHGLSFIFAASGGYIIGFIFAATFIGYMFDHYVNARKPVQTVILMLIANFVFIYIPGLIGLYNAMLAKTGTPLSLTQLLLMGVVPFIVGDLIKIALASGITTSILPKEE
ncbi:MAG: biotin transporter BioY [Methanosphaera sp.]|uniref:biotin transporter BioY n=1 Tax=Methanosphaera sp. ISO3-F5 TaxID=1452353 RepID=UPI002B25903F|nr:biotin transporter BioY [Methanosphaera sp. ISO3-F5]MBR0472856.1 biotin transporter BioY [Methanosphaera sp.]WQH64286.1 biotin transporter BioY [Methanosphaera sp. ISO3-F5]